MVQGIVVEFSNDAFGAVGVHDVEGEGSKAGEVRRLGSDTALVLEESDIADPQADGFEFVREVLRTSFFRRWMARRHLKQEDVAGLLNVSKRAVAGYATGSAAIDTPTSLAIGLIAGYAKAVNDPAVLTERVREIERLIG